MTYIVVGISCQSSDVHELSTSLLNGNLSGSVTQGGSEVVEKEGRCWSMVGRLELDDGHPVERGYFGFLDDPRSE